MSNLFEIGDRSVHTEFLNISERILRSAGFLLAHSDTEVSWTQAVDEERKLKIEADLSQSTKKGIFVARAVFMVEEVSSAAQIVVDRGWRPSFVKAFNNDPFANYIFDVFASHPANDHATILS